MKKNSITGWLSAVFVVISVCTATAQTLYTPEDIIQLRKDQTENRLKQERKKYPIKIVEQIPVEGVGSFFDYFNTDEEMIGFVKGKYAVCSDSKKIFYFTPGMKAIMDGTLSNKVDLKERQAWFDHMLKKYAKFSGEYQAILSSKNIADGMKKFSDSFKTEFIDIVKHRKSTDAKAQIETDVLLWLAHRSGMGHAGEFAVMYNRLITMQTQRLASTRPQLPDENASEEEIQLYNEKAKQYVENYKTQKSQMDEIIHRIELIYGKRVSEIVISNLRDMRDNAVR